MTYRIDPANVAITTNHRDAYVTTPRAAAALADLLAADGNPGFTYKVMGLVPHRREVAVFVADSDDSFMGGFLGYVARPLPVAD